jgi:hypothetical protein
MWSPQRGVELVKLEGLEFVTEHERDLLDVRKPASCPWRTSALASSWSRRPPLPLLYENPLRLST